jgi:hypothetical protein
MIVYQLLFRGKGQKLIYRVFEQTHDSREYLGRVCYVQNGTSRQIGPLRWTRDKQITRKSLESKNTARTVDSKMGYSEPKMTQKKMLNVSMITIFEASRTWKRKAIELQKRNIYAYDTEKEQQKSTNSETAC